MPCPLRPSTPLPPNGSRQTPTEDPGPEEAAGVADAAEDCGLALWVAAGPDFQLQLLQGLGCPPGTDQLLEVR